mmetsp:Transcript_45024/g.134532  ORF Transcript_45024/g.134532 Transcript_45024/m.134532 type:complete len:236 (+) Transcript_45024:650-1357(+)
MRDVVAVGTGNESPDWQAHLPGHERRGQIAQGTRRQDQVKRIPGLQVQLVQHPKIGPETVGHLRQGATEVGGVDAAEAMPRRQGVVGGQALQRPVHVVAATLERRHPRAVCHAGRHLPALEVRDLAVRVKDNNVQARGAGVADRAHGRRACVPGGGHQHGPPLASALGEARKHPDERLLPEVLEAERRPMEELRHEEASNAPDRHDLGAAKAGVATVHELAQLLAPTELVAHKEG